MAGKRHLSGAELLRTIKLRKNSGERPRIDPVLDARVKAFVTKQVQRARRQQAA